MVQTFVFVNTNVALAAAADSAMETDSFGFGGMLDALTMVEQQEKKKQNLSVLRKQKKYNVTKNHHQRIVQAMERARQNAKTEVQEESRKKIRVSKQRRLRDRRRFLRTVAKYRASGKKNHFALASPVTSLKNKVSTSRKLIASALCAEKKKSRGRSECIRGPSAEDFEFDQEADIENQYDSFTSFRTKRQIVFPNDSLTRPSASVRGLKRVLVCNSQPQKRRRIEGANHFGSFQQ